MVFEIQKSARARSLVDQWKCLTTAVNGGILTPQAYKMADLLRYFGLRVNSNGVEFDRAVGEECFEGFDRVAVGRQRACGSWRGERVP